MNGLAFSIVLLTPALTTAAQTAAVPATAANAPPSATSTSAPIITATIRERTNVTEWFAATPTSETYPHQDSLLRLSLAQRIRRWDYQLELGQSAEISLPTDAVSSVTAQGQLGLGGTYYASGRISAAGLPALSLPGRSGSNPPRPLRVL
jgi:hypothetical protein